MKTTVKKSARNTAMAVKPLQDIDEANASARHQMIQEAAYYLAERRGFANGSPEEDWLTAEAQVDGQLSKLH